LDLSILYGDGPGSERHGYLYREDGASFRLGQNVLKNGQQFDLPLDHFTGRPQAADERSADNLILRQICVLFLKLHNLAVADLPTKLGEKKRFHFARQRVRWQYQWLVRHHFLFNVSDPEIYHRVVVDGERIGALRRRYAIGSSGIDDRLPVRNAFSRISSSLENHFDAHTYTRGALRAAAVPDS
jgi:hypothetical protein